MVAQNFHGAKRHNITRFENRDSNDRRYWEAAGGAAFARLRDRALFDLALASKLRGCDLVEIEISDGEQQAERSRLGRLPIIER